MKKLALVVSVAAIVAAPLAQASSTLTGSLRYGLSYVDAGGTTDADFSAQNFGSRIKWKGDSDLGNGMTGFGNMELRLNGERNSNVVNRLYRVGVKGGFGTVSVGLQDSAFDLVNPDDTWWNGGTGLVGNRNEKHGVLKYENSFGDIKVAAAATMQSGDVDEDVADIIDAAVKYSANGITFGVGVQSLAGEGNAADGIATAITAGYATGDLSVTATFGLEDEDYTAGETRERTGIDIQAWYGDFFGWYSQTELDGAAETPFRIGVGYTQSLSDNMLIWYELYSDDTDVAGSDATTAFNTALKIDF